MKWALMLYAIQNNSNSKRSRLHFLLHQGFRDALICGQHFKSDFWGKNEKQIQQK